MTSLDDCGQKIGKNKRPSTRRKYREMQLSEHNIGNEKIQRAADDIPSAKCDFTWIVQHAQQRINKGIPKMIITKSQYIQIGVKEGWTP